MDNIMNYDLIEKIYESTNSLVYRGILKHDNQPVILKILKENYPSFTELTRYKQEYEITCSLNADNIIKAYALQRYKNSLVIFLEDFGGQSLKLFISKTRFSLKEFLIIGIKIVEALAVIHTANIIHKDINPANIVYNQETGQLKIIDFGISSLLSSEIQTLSHINQLEGTLAYIAPEQTGRINRGIDYRADFYALGVTFYEMLTQQLPFTSNDLIELVHAHIAQQPKKPDELVSSIPATVSNIVLKLLSKTPEERYQSAWGIKADLKICLDQLTTLGEISQFPLASQDITDRFQIPQKLYGREQEITQLLTTFERVSQGSSEIILVSGYSGIGKSALVNEIHKPITRQKGFFINGKFDQLQRDIPYVVITQVFQDLIRQLLSEPKQVLEIWKEKILQALGNNGQIILDVIPELEKIIGKQMTVEELRPNEAQNRFNLFFERFIRVFSQKEHPLVIFFDDLQWVDLPSLNLIEQVITNTDSQYLLIIGAYRDNEVSSTHPLMHSLDQIKKTNTRINQIILRSLVTDDVSQLISDTLLCSINGVKPLAELITNKTGGNAFFIIQLLQTLYKEKLLFFNRKNLDVNLEKIDRGYWQWDIEQIQALDITNNVVDLMVRKIAGLDEITQNILKLAACIGNKFNLDVLSIVNRKSQTITSQELQLALEEGLIIPLSNDYKVPLLWNQEEISTDADEISPAFIPKYPEYIPYKFLHDRVQQAAYLLIPEDEKEAIHLQIGRLLLNSTQENELEDNLFNIVNQLNKGSVLITDQLEKIELAKLNLQSAKKSKASAAYAASLKYLEAGTKLLVSNSWDCQYELTWELSIETLELLYLNLKFEQFEEMAEFVIEKAQDILDKAKVNQLKILYYYTTFKPHKAIDNALATLLEIGINVDLAQESSNILSKITQAQEFIQSVLGDKKIEDLANLPLISDPIQLAATRILQQIVTSTLTTNFPLFVEVILIQINLCMKYGNPPHAPYIYSTYGMVLCSLKKDFIHGYEFGNLALKLVEDFNTPKLEAFVIQMYYGQIWHWKESLRNIAAQNKLIHGFNIGIDTGENEFASYAAIDYCLIKFLGGQHLAEVDEEYQKYAKYLKNLKQEFCIYSINSLYKIAINFYNIDLSSDLIIGSSQKEEAAYLEKLIATNDHWLLFFIYFGKTLYFYFEKKYSLAYINAINAEKYVMASSSFLTSPQHNFYASLSYLAYYSSCDLKQQIELLEQVDRNQENMKLWAGNCVDNFQHKYDLVAAEKARVLGQYWQAEELYERAIQGAKQFEFIHEEALAYERAAEFYLQLGRKEIGQLYLRNAYHCYSYWGAKVKVKQLEDEYLEYLILTTNQGKAKKLSTMISTTGTHGDLFDLTTVIKASQAIAEEIILSKLLAKLMKVMIENAGAEKGFLLLPAQNNWVIEAVGAVDSDEVTILQSIAVDSLDTSTQTTLLSNSIINYVVRTRENVVLNDASREGQFTRESYIIITQPKSILCIPLINQGKLNGILYLENNLTTGVFTPERVQILNILSSRAAISIENSRLYATLEQKVEERTQELLQTLELLKATQAKLVFENALLKGSEEAATYDYQVGGSLPIDATTYVVRSADRHLYKGLKNGAFCYILNTRQMGKSSLMVRMMHHLQQEGFCCAAIDMTRIGNENITPEQWYKGLLVELWQGFDLLDKINLKSWWQERLDISPVQRVSRFLEEVLLTEVNLPGNTQPQIVIFLDEIDSVLGLDFSVNDFFALVRSCYNQRSINPQYKRLCFALFGVATPGDLIADYRRTPFNIGQGIQLDGFQLHEAQPLLQGLSDKVSNPQAVLKEVLFWTNGQPFLTQKVCQLIRSLSSSVPERSEKVWVENLIRTNIIENWEAQDEPEHLRTIRDRLLNGEHQTRKILALYQEVWQLKQLSTVDTPEARELILSGLLIKQQGYLKIHNRIYELIFNSSWIDNNIQYL